MRFSCSVGSSEPLGESKVDEFEGLGPTEHLGGMA